MRWFGDDSSQAQNNADVYQTDGHKSHWTHEVIGGAAGFEAMKAYEAHCTAEGKPQSHALAKELIAGFASAEVDKLFETKGLDFIDKEKAKHEAKKQAQENFTEEVYVENY